MHEFTRDGRGAEFVKVDLHLHTPGSHDYSDEITPIDLVNEFESEELDLVAVTDHNTSGWYEELRDVIDDPENDFSVEILPGVEITTRYGSDRRVHMTAIFPPDQHDSVDYVLGQIGINSSEPEEAMASPDISEICRCIRDEGGIPILAHVDAPAGADYEFERENPIKEELFDPDNCAALEIVEPENEGELGDFPYIRSSDAHSPEEIGRGFTYIKMTQPSFEGLRTALADPESRISLEHSLYDHPSIDGLYVNGGFLEDRELLLNKNLNCIIGGRGKGKSTVIEFVRYALDVTPRSNRIREEYDRLIENNLGAGVEIELHLTANNGEPYVVKREFNDDPVVYRADGEVSGMDIETFRNQFFDPEIHSQRELLDLARDEMDQLDLLDSYFDVEDIFARRRDVKDELQQNARNLSQALDEKERLCSELREIDAVRERVSVMEERGVEEYISDQDLWDEERQTLNRVESEIESAIETAEDGWLAGELTNIESIDDDWPNSELLEELSELTEQTISSLEGLESQIEESLRESLEDYEGIRTSWDEREEDRHEEYEAVADEIREETGVDLQDYFDQKEELERLEGLQEQLDEVEARITELNTERNGKLAELEEVRRELTEERRQGIRDLNVKLNDVRVNINPQDNKSEYIDWFDEVLRGSNLRTQDKEAVANEYSPRVLADIILERDTERLVQGVGITENAAETMVNFDSLRDRVYELQIMEVRDRPVVEINDRGWKSMDEMSDGQQVTSLLSMTMVERDTPLIIDEPENSLDNDFIVSGVVEVVRQIKHDRQLIVVTHNANIPILGDAEKIVVMDSNGRRGFFSSRGSIDNPEVKERSIDILEGGEEAFRLRDQKYRRTP